MTTTTTTKKKTTTKSTSLELPRNPFVFEVLDLASKQRSKAKKVEVLKKYRDNGLVAVLIWNFDETITSLLPDNKAEVVLNLNFSISSFIERSFSI